MTAKDCVVGRSFSVRESINGWSEGCMNMLDILIGLPDLQNKNLELKLHEERAKYLVCELKCPFEDSLGQYIDFIRKMILKNSTEKGSIEDEKAPMLNFIFHTPQGTEIDLRLCSKEVMSKAKPVLMKILETEARGWFPDFREKIILELKSKNICNSDLEDEANRRINSEYVRRVSDAVLESDEISEIGPGIAKLLSDQVRAGVIYQEALQSTEQLLNKRQQEEKRYLEENYPIRSKIHTWMTRRLQKRKQENILANQWMAHNIAISVCKKQGLTQHAYFLSRDLSFLQDQEPILEKELTTNLKTPTREYQFRTHIWNPENWIITKSYQGSTEVIPTVVHDGPSKTLSFTRHSPSSDRPVYLVQKETVLNNDTKNPFWRWTNFFYRTYSWTLNFLFLFSIVLPWCSPFSLRSLFYFHPFLADYEVSQLNGSLHKKPSSLTQTLASRLQELWRSVSKSRTDFEAKPDRGLLGKSVLRHFNRFINYVVKGVLGTVLISAVFPLLCLLISLTSLMLAVTGPVLVPVFSLILHLISIITFDIETHNFLVSLIPSIFWNIIVLGIIQPIICITVSMVLCPLLAGIIAMTAVTRKGRGAVLMKLIISVLT